MVNLIKIRDYQPTDKEKVLKLIRLNTPEFFASQEEEELKEYLETKRELYYVVLLDGEIVGCGGINFQDIQTMAIISWDIFHPEYQGKSLGTQLMKHRLSKLNTIESIEKTIVRTSQLAYKFYEKQGFQLLEIKKDYWAEGLDMFYMKLIK